MHVMKQNGWIEIICGSMFSGKSEELIRRIRRATYANLSIQVFKPTIDNRYDDTAVVSHNGTSITAQPIDRAEEIYDHINEGTEVVGIDEVQFFDETIVEIAERIGRKGNPCDCGRARYRFSRRTVWTRSEINGNQ